MANCHDRGGVTACVLYKDQFRKKKGDTKYNYPFRSFKSHLLLLLVPACSTYAQPAVRSFYQPLIQPCDISSKSDLSMEGGVQYEFFFRGTFMRCLPEALHKTQCSCTTTKTRRRCPGAALISPASPGSLCSSSMSRANEAIPISRIEPSQRCVRSTR